MRAMYERGVQIEITNACNKVCAGCSRFCGHHLKPFFMDLSTFERTLQSLVDFPHNMGIIGGEPTLHPEFAEICELLRKYQKYIPIERLGFFTNGAQWAKYESVIKKTFLPQRIVYNDHDDPECHHQPLLAASQDIVKDKELWRKLIDDCWLQKRWCSSITPKGVFFCEAAAALDALFDGPGGYPIESGWWKREPADFQDQVERYCVNCSAAIPMPPVADVNKGKDLITSRIARMLEAVSSPRYAKGNVVIFDEELSVEQIDEYANDWKPWYHRPFRQCGPNSFLDGDGNVVSHKVFHLG